MPSSRYLAVSLFVLSLAYCFSQVVAQDELGVAGVHVLPALLVLTAFCLQNLPIFCSPAIKRGSVDKLVVQKGIRVIGGAVASCRHWPMVLSVRGQKSAWADSCSCYRKQADQESRALANKSFGLVVNADRI